MKQPLQVGFAGTPEFAKVALDAIVQAGFPVRMVLSQPDRPAGRGMKLAASPVKQLAQSLHIPVYQPVSLRKGEDAQIALQALANAADGKPLDVLVVAAYGLILPPAVLAAPVLGCLNIHASLLPRWRGAAPIHRAIEAGDDTTGICIMQMDEGLDTGAVGLTLEQTIAPTDTTATLHDTLAALGGRAIVQALTMLQAGQWQAQPQVAEGVTYADKISKAEGQLDWSLPAPQLQRKVRAFDPFPGASTPCGGEIIKCFGAQVCAAHGVGHAPGEVLGVGPQGVLVQCGQGVLQLSTLQRPGGRRAPAAQVAEALGIVAGQRLGHS